MNKSQGLNAFWNGFNLPAYDVNSVPDGASFPYITYTESQDSLGNVLVLNASIWDRSTSWERISLKADEIARKIGEHGHYTIKLDNGYIWLVKGTPFAQRMNDPTDDQIKRIYINVLAEYLTAY